jgi:hypothetical protein
MRSRYYQLANPIDGPERQRCLRYWNAEPGGRFTYLQNMALCGGGLGFMHEDRLQLCLQRFNAEVERYGIAYQGGCLGQLTRRIPRTIFRESHLADHPTYFARKGDGVTAVVWQPYHIEADELRWLTDTCGEYELTLEVSTERSWHYPGWTIALIITNGG